MNETSHPLMESPQFLRMSLAAAMTLGLRPGLFYRNAKLYCINLLLTYGQGCAARCAYCGLSHKRPGEYDRKSFIRVTWPTHGLEEILDRMASKRDRIKRVCISMITHGRAIEDTRDICKKIRDQVDIPVSLLLSPTLLGLEDLKSFKEAGADKVGIAIDLATPELFDQYRGKGVGGPHRWERYWECLGEALEVFGEGQAGSHFMVGMGETERQMVEAIQGVRDMGGRTHLFSFFPEAESALAQHLKPPMEQYRRVQVARYLIDQGLGRADKFHYQRDGKIEDYGIPWNVLDPLIEGGEPFRTSGCTGRDGEVACNRPYANSRPGPHIRNFPFPPEPQDIRRIRRQMGLPSPSPVGVGIGIGIEKFC